MPEDRALLKNGVRLALSRIPGTQFDVAAALGVSPTTILRWSSGAAEPRAAHLARLASKSGLSEEAIRNGGAE